MSLSRRAAIKLTSSMLSLNCTSAPVLGARGHVSGARGLMQSKQLLVPSADHRQPRRALSAAQPLTFSSRTSATAVRTPETARNRHQRTLNGLFAHPTSMNIKWHDVQHMLEHFGCEVTESKNTQHRMRIALGDEAFYIDRPHGKDNQKSLTDKGEIVALRSFLARIGLAPHQSISFDEGLDTTSAVDHRAEHTGRLADIRAESVPEQAADGDHWLVVVDRHETSLYHTMTKGSIPSQLRPYDPIGIRHKLKHKKPQGQFPVFHGDSVPEDPSYYKSISHELRDAKQVILAGHGTGKASATGQLIDELRRHSPDVLAKVAARITLPAHHLSENQLLAAVRTIYRNNWLPALTGWAQHPGHSKQDLHGGPAISLSVRDHGKHVVVSRALGTEEEAGGGGGAAAAAATKMHG